ncbi:MAG: cyanophycin synthetase [Bdellovibrionales bacterium RIFCSPHIGHO2_01_FULL_40_29]|nr:MAG: cyanophycin synthetase [Bdellovibrionales bacterium RIFCSPHIGHO2_01_FULL_40_29]OFZ32414.1 MAG: cyanophycin synthetase [Bdellovibrionales bacterium RIFCSPHIGHO2_02_FULL_40_15]
MELLWIKTVFGPNVYHSQPIVIMKVSLNALTEVSSLEIPGFNQRLLDLFPGLMEHTCSLGTRGGFAQRLQSGTYLAHITEHVAIELSQLSGIGVRFGKTRHVGKTGHYEIAVTFKNEKGMCRCLEEAFTCIQALLKNEYYDVKKAVLGIQVLVRDTGLGPSTLAILNAAQERNIPVRRIDSLSSLYQLGFGKARRFIQAASSNQTSLIAADVVQDKFLTKNLLKHYFLPTPDGLIIRSVDELKTISKRLRPPLVVKPFNGNQGKGVTLNLTSPVELESAFHFAQKTSSSVLIEEMCFGDDFRILVVGGKMVAAAMRNPPKVIGDGESTIQELIEALNSDPARGEGHEALLTKVQIDEVLLSFLDKQQLTLKTVPAADVVVVLRGNANISCGGTAIDVTGIVHPEIKSLSERVARLFNLDICGIDLIHTDISAAVNEQTKVIEVNAVPGLRMHLTAFDGSPRDVGGTIVDMLFPRHQSARIPIISVTGTNGKTTVSRLIQKILSENGFNVGLTTTDGIWIGSEKIASGDTTGPQSSETVLADPQVDCAVLEVARGGLVRGGLAYDWSDVGVITNICPDHIGQDGIENIKDLIWIKSLVAERVREGGVLVLNANDEASSGLKEHPRIKSISRKVFLYSMDRQTPCFREHLLQGGSGVWAEAGSIFIKNGEGVSRLMAIEAIPLTLNGTVTFQVSNVLAAIAVCSGLKIDAAVIVKGLMSFRPVHDNPGRFSLYQVRGGHVIVDYGHNPEALSAVSRFMKHWQGGKKTAVLGLPGDRTDDLLIQSAEVIAKNFNTILIKEDNDLRGRQPGEVGRILARAVHDKNPRINCDIVLDEKEAITKALRTIDVNELVIIFYDNLATTMECLKEFDPIPLEGIPNHHRRRDKSARRARAQEDLKSYSHGIQ